MTHDVVSLKQINRSYLRRQLLLERVSMPTADAISHLVALQAQDVMPPYVGLWSRLENFDWNDLHQGLLDKSLVRATMLRSTVHLATRQDALRIIPKMLPEHVKHVQAPTALGGLFARVDLEAMVAWGKAILGDRDLGAAEMQELAKRDWPDFDPVNVKSSVHWLQPLVQVPPRGLWKTNARPRWAMAEAWLCESFDESYDLADLTLRYITAYGPIGVGDFQVWSRLTGAKQAMARLRPQLCMFRDEAAKEMLDVPGAEWPDPETPVPVRLLGAFDNLWLSHKDRSRVLDDRHRLKIINNGIGRPTILVDGFVAGRYRVTVKKDIATLTAEPFRRYTRDERREVAAEAERLLAFLEPGLSHRIEFADTFL